jgi:hypothetical protein
MSQQTQPPQSNNENQYEVDGEWLKSKFETLEGTIAGLGEALGKLANLGSESQKPPEQTEQKPPENLELKVTQPEGQQNGQRRRSQLVIRNPFAKPNP